MRINKIKINNIKGKSGEYKLDSINLIQGLNSSGKSAILDAVKIACLGYHPDLGKSNKALYYLASAPEMESSCQFSDGSVSTLKLKQNPDGSVSKEFDCSESMSESNISFDSSIYFDGSASERRKIVFSNISNDDKMDNLKSIVSDIRSLRPSPSDQEMEVIEYLIEKIKNFFLENDNTVDAFLEIESFLNELLAASRKQIKEQQGRVESYATQHSELDEAGLPLDYLENESKLINSSLRSNIEKKGQIESLIDEIVFIKNSISELEDYSKKKPNEDTINKLRNAIEENKKAVEQKVNSLQNELNDLDKLHEEKLKFLKNLQNKSFEKVCNEIQNGSYLLEVEINKSGNDIGTVVWSGKSLSAETESASDKKYSIQKQIKIYKEEANKTINELRSELDELLIDREKFNKAKEIDLLKDRLAQSQIKLSDLGSLNSVQEMIESKETELERIEKLLKKANKAELASKTLNESKDTYDRINIEYNLIKETRKQFLDSSDALTGEMINGILNKLNIFTEICGLSPYTIQDGEIGYYKNNRYVTHSTFSGSEKALLNAAVNIAFAMKSKIKIALIDELGRFDEDRKRKFFIGIKNLIDNKMLDQMICIDVSLPLSIDEINIIQP